MGVHVTRRGVLLGGLAVAGGALCTGLLGAGPAWALDSPSIIDCDGWDARTPAQPVAVHDRRPARILVHHTATPNVTDLSRDAAGRLARLVQDFHMDDRGWLDSGQHFTISRGGYVLEGRHRSLELLREGRRHGRGRALHRAEHHRGRHRERGHLHRDRADRPAVGAAARAVRLRLPAVPGAARRRSSGTAIKDTACPGDVLYGMLPQLRTEVAALLGTDLSPAEADTESWPLLRVADRGTDVLAAQHLLRAAGPHRGGRRRAVRPGAPPTRSADSSRPTGPSRSTA